MGVVDGIYNLICGLSTAAKLRILQKLDDVLTPVQYFLAYDHKLFDVEYDDV